MKLFFAADQDIALLPFFLKHYVGLGVTHFYCSSTKTGLEFGQGIYTHYPYQNIPLYVYESCIEPGEPYFRGVQSSFFEMIDYTVGEDEWYMIAELDEFHVYSRPVSDIIRECNHSCHQPFAVYGKLLDRVSPTGDLPELKLDIPLEVQFPRHSDISKHVGNFCDDKVMLCKGRRKIDGGNHSLAGEPEIYPDKFQVYHYKWHSNVLKRMRERVLMDDEGHRWVDGNRRILDYWEKHRTVLA